MSEASTEVTTSTASVKPRTSAQMEALQRARVKALEVRQRNKELRDKQKEIDRAAVEQTKRQNSERIQREYESLVSATQQEHKGREVQEPSLIPAQEEEEVEEEVVYQKKEKKPRTKRVIVVQQSSSDEEEEVEVRLPPKRERPENKQEDAYFYRKAYNRMFGLD